MLHVLSRSFDRVSFLLEDQRQSGLVDQPDGSVDRDFYGAASVHWRNSNLAVA